MGADRWSDESTWRDLVGETFTIHGPGGPVERLRLDEVVSAAQGFSLYLSGSTDSILVQRTYRFDHESDSVDIFIVPIGRDDQATRYEAVFS